MTQLKSGGRQAGQRQCPWVREPFDECYCKSLNSMSTEAAIYYCGGNFEECDIYRQHAEEGGVRR